MRKSVYNQKCTINKIIGLINSHYGSKASSSVRRSLTNQYWYSADCGLYHMLFALCVICKPDCLKLKLLSKKYKDKVEFDSTDIDETYVFATETYIVDMLARNWVARTCAYLWLNMFCRNKARYGAEIPRGCHYDVVHTKPLLHLLHGVLLSDNYFYLPDWKNYTRRTLSVSEWKNEWNKYCTILPADWD